ncbi:MAG: hypothetical protein LBH72_00070 [Proteiniphilum sp.]|jgi:hypothetical protein|nr:hypothetical protein [Proteiniphilum sp.]
MAKEIQKPFLKAFQFGGVVHNCIDVIRHRYDLGYLPQDKPLPEKWQIFYDKTLPEKIIKETDDFDDAVIIYTESPLIDEIEENIKGCKTDSEQERYIFSLLTPFKELSDIFHPIAEIGRLNNAIDECKNDKEMWESVPENEPLTNVAGEAAGTPKEQINACDWFIEKYTKDIERICHINRRFCEIVCGQINEQGSVEQCLGAFVSIKTMFANRLDALLLTYGIDLMKLQRESGVYLKSHRIITDVDYYIGSRELAQRYIDALPKLEQSQPDTARQTKIQTERTQIDQKQLDVLFESLKGCITPYDKDSFIYAFNGGEKPKGYNGMKKTKKITDAQFVYLIAYLFSIGDVVDWTVAHEFGIKNPSQKMTNYRENKNKRPQGYKFIDDIIDRMKKEEKTGS